MLIASLYNPNIAWDEYSRLVALAEVEAVGMLTKMVGYDSEKASGVFTFGGTGTTLYGVKIGHGKGVPGNPSKTAPLRMQSCSCQMRDTIAQRTLSGGSVSERTIWSQFRQLMKTKWISDDLRKAVREALTNGKKIAAIIATLGTTDAFGLDDLESIVTLRDTLVDEFQLDYQPHIHADAVIGWAWSVFNDYNFEENPLGFRPRTIRALAGACRRIRHLSLADSIGIDFHKTGFAPYISSLVLVKDETDLGLVKRQPEQMPYLYHFGDHRPGMFTLETSRTGTGAPCSTRQSPTLWTGRVTRHPRTHRRNDATLTRTSRRA